MGRMILTFWAKGFGKLRLCCTFLTVIACGMLALAVPLRAEPTTSSTLPSKSRPKLSHPKAIAGLHAPTGWTHGVWKHRWHGGRYGWWWYSGGHWYFYLVPVYPYPPYYGNGPIPIGAIPYPPPGESPYGGVFEPPSLSRWYCLSPPGFYPFVTSCAGGWVLTGGPG